MAYRMEINLEKALEIYYSMPQIGSKEISTIFNTKTTKTISDLKKQARALMVEEDVPLWSSTTVCTETAFRAWGLDPIELEKKYKKLQSLKKLRVEGAV